MKKITSIGEILFDVYTERRALGGAPFNFIYHIIKLTGKGSFVSRIGDDDAGNEIIDFLEKKNIPKDYIQIDPQYPTGESVAKLDQKKIPDWNIKTGTAYDHIELTEDLELLINNNTDCLYFGTLAQRSLKTRDTIQHFFNKELKYFCDLNIRQNFYTKEIIKDCLETCNVLKLNIEELRLVNNLFFNKSFDTNETPKRLLNEYNLSQLCVTYGEEGAVILRGNENIHYKQKTDMIVDTVGAGDAFAAVFSLGYLNNWDIEKTNKIASEFAGEIVKINGALPAGETLYNKYKQIIND